jgi:hypothetical protein
VSYIAHHLLIANVNFINVLLALDRKLVFAVQGLGYLLRTLILDLDKGIHITNDDISAFKHWPHTPYYVSKQLNDEFITIKILNDDNTFSTVQLQGDSSSDKFLKTNDTSDIFFIDNRYVLTKRTVSGWPFDVLFLTGCWSGSRTKRSTKSTLSRERLSILYPHLTQWRYFTAILSCPSKWIRVKTAQQSRFTKSIRIRRCTEYNLEIR